MSDHSPAGAYSGARRRWSLLALIGANLLPLVGVVFLGWDIAALVVLYWSENLVLGFYALLKMIVVGRVSALPYAAFFLLHYGGFCAVHGLFILVLLVNPEAEILSGEEWPLFLVFLQLLLEVIQQVLAFAPADWIWAFAALLVSHGVSFGNNFLQAGEWRQVTVNRLMGAPYARIVVLHVSIIAGAFVTMALGQPVFLLLVLVLLKTWLDVVMHQRAHRKLVQAAA